MKKIIATLFMFSILVMAGCGQTGPLYMPEDAPKNEQPSQ